MDQTHIRNFAVIAHIDHGKSTFADRIMEICGAVGKDHLEQLLDSLELEREHGITIKLKAIRLVYRKSLIVNRDTKSPNERSTINDSQVQDFILNLIDTPGHVDFSYEVSRSLASVEGAILLVDATQGVQAQTLSNFNLALEANLVLIPVINKIDSPQAEVEKTASELAALGFRKEEILAISSKTGENVKGVLDQIITKIPPPKIKNEGLAALIFDSSLDPYKGVVASVRLFEGEVKVGDEVKFLATGAKAEILQAGYLTPSPKYVEKLSPGDVGFVVTNLKDLSLVKVGDTITLSKNPAKALAGYKEAKPVVFLSFYPTDAADFGRLKNGLEKLKLNDAALSFAPEFSASLGQGLRVGFLGLLHAQITQERLEREYDLDIIATSPSVSFIVDGKQINNPSDFDPAKKDVKEPYARVTIFIPEKYYGAVSNLIHDRRGELTNFENIGNLLKIDAQIPLLELLIGFYDQLKTITSGYASEDFEPGEYRAAHLVKLDILVNHEPIEGLAQIVPAEKAEAIARRLVEKLKEAIPRQQIAIPIQAAIGGKIIARETIASFRKDVTQKLYGGDVTRKMKLLEKQKKGKKRMRKFGQVDIPQEAFLAVLKIY
ncbi:elongation factor 4 [Candidatus Curtissbacteria bacterium RIFCSPHIGHO2_01_FULL_41_44]|uniref:Elongation factor 4 n=1 Tax=Candidatus Curtissbacteria bacterium RIFCSPLOWO2_01_FULL_42_50 TaxID=1797730 RepID=A0A1F5H472_9BACT|nr:MAG: elongation factor 4 [Candidatus Curtissbacteria bacterium RIFCSPHIGHO2_01_FULL_41_44]OGD93383.1 MAG: elongation factor 4 [Candidatus Curtissbacteria bacterium RIFCSPHIGHO2_02_FULL_42_58]OGD97099.1 MAG: elongation factor 4 [Candidatus Curtissbacteria bacterium RIFCSPHIGHO2_12_FULL_42_33]OGD98888.1 MAG: elongation factor 4 [Candidatus Curtissbacteria bacterium RIFCSPLOWO2_01_FULL_42_50]OGE03009.1 MAG: elongation factor 4 [Candidatus Curtissbacteria bacterium RIFCSPLOWO2_12_FULL_41_16]OGE